MLDQTLFQNYDLPNCKMSRMNRKKGYYLQHTL